MARLITCGFEALASFNDTANVFGGEGDGAGGELVGNVHAAASISDVRSGIGTTEFRSTDATAAYVGWVPTGGGVLNRRYRFRFYVKLKGTPTAASTILKTFVTTGSAGPSVKLNTDRSLSLYKGAGTLMGSSSPLVVGQWYRVEVSVIAVNSTTSQAGFKIDGADVVAETTADTAYSGNAVNTWLLGKYDAVSVGVDFHIDDVALNDDQGTAQNSWPGAGGILLLVPSGDSQDGAWLRSDTGTATDNYSEIDDRPALGTSLDHSVKNTTSTLAANDLIVTLFSPRNSGSTPQMTLGQPFAYFSGGSGNVGVSIDWGGGTPADPRGSGTGNADKIETANSGVAPGTSFSGNNWVPVKAMPSYTGPVEGTAPTLRVARTSGSSAYVMLAGAVVEYVTPPTFVCVGTAAGVGHLALQQTGNARSIFDDFEAGTLNTSKWDDQGTVTFSGGDAVMSAASANYLDSSGYGPLALITSGVTTQLTQTPTGAGGIAFVRVGPDLQTTNAYIYLQNGTLHFGLLAEGVATDTATLAYVAGSHAWWRIREKNGTLFFDTSGDGSTWTNRASVSRPWFVGAVLAMFGADNAGASSGNAAFEHVNGGPQFPDFTAGCGTGAGTATVLYPVATTITLQAATGTGVGSCACAPPGRVDTQASLGLAAGAVTLTTTTNNINATGTGVAAGGSLGIRVKINMPLAAGAAVMAGTLTCVVDPLLSLSISTASGVPRGDITVPTRVPVDITVGQSTATGAVTALKPVPLNPATGSALNALVMTAVPRFTLSGAATGGSSLAMTAATVLPVNASAGLAGGSFGFTATATVVSQPAGGVGQTTLTLRATAIIPLQATQGVAVGQLSPKVSPALTLTQGGGTAAGVLRLHRMIPCTPGAGVAGGVMTFVVPAGLVISGAAGAITSLTVKTTAVMSGVMAGVGAGQLGFGRFLTLAAAAGSASTVGALKATASLALSTLGSAHGSASLSAPVIVKATGVGVAGSLALLAAAIPISLTASSIGAGSLGLHAATRVALSAGAASGSGGNLGPFIVGQRIFGLAGNAGAVGALSVSAVPRLTFAGSASGAGFFAPNAGTMVTCSPGGGQCATVCGLSSSSVLTVSGGAATGAGVYHHRVAAVVPLQGAVAGALGALIIIPRVGGRSQGAAVGSLAFTVPAGVPLGAALGSAGGGVTWARVLTLAGAGVCGSGLVLRTSETPVPLQASAAAAFAGLTFIVPAVIPLHANACSGGGSLAVFGLFPAPRLVRPLTVRLTRRGGARVRVVG